MRLIGFDLDRVGIEPNQDDDKSESLISAESSFWKSIDSDKVRNAAQKKIPFNARVRILICKFCL